MLQNYFKVALRHLTRNKVYSAINIGGLAVGIAACILIFLFVKDELSYDRYHAKADRVYRVTRDFVSGNGSVSLHLARVAPPVGPLLQQDFPQIEAVARMVTFGILFEDKETQRTYSEDNVYFAEPAVFEMFDIELVNGNREKALREPFTILLSQEMAEKYYPGENPVGKVLHFGENSSLRVEGVFKPFPANSHLHPDFLGSFITLNDTTVYGAEQLKTNWGNNSFPTYVLLESEKDAAQLEAQFPAFLDKHLAGTDHADGAKPSDFTNLYLQKLTDIHLKSNLDSELEVNGDMDSIMILSAVALIILLIACINYINLSTARATTRAKEVGVRKVIGAARQNLVLQFLLESVLTVSIATLLALGLVELCLPWLNTFTDKALDFNLLSDNWLLALVFLLPLLVGILAGLYPALYLSHFQAATVLKGALSNSSKNPMLRKTLVVVQFSVSIILIIATGIIFQQLMYIQNKDLGFDKDQLVILPDNSEMRPQFEAFKAELLKSSAIEGVGRSQLIPTEQLLNSAGAQVAKGDSMAPTTASIKFVTVDHDMFDVYNIKLVAGRNFSREYRSDDTAAYVLNEAAVRMIGWSDPQQAINQRFTYGGNNGRIIGVVNDINFESLHKEIAPMVFMIRGWGNYQNISIKIGGDTPQALAHIEETWNKFLPNYPFEYEFMDQLYGQTYEAEQKKGQIFTLFSCMAILIACLGLFGLASYTTVQRRKEIGIRKVFGAPVASIVALISKDFMKLVLVANILAWPIAWYAMRSWLDDFAYRINIGTDIFILAGIVAFIIAMATISYQAIRAATSDPVKSIRTE
ncbi:ABC transporter permease [Pontibacter akesuensis]|uniref:Putative ABC transport system permease protein n=1 Tax=Pontibacter akesuensis TaxID=388950 RepID=A0A1I7H1P6_9BACT|nr:ABC transporter permease [Pontibacter akesuensis]GHA54044.1 ABC transporter permease [Pontibacter akesuensis]SFU54426.1 putative ABC transport system permease protein [Pontibacter akesuensis]